MWNVSEQNEKNHVYDFSVTATDLLTLSLFTIIIFSWA